MNNFVDRIKVIHKCIRCLGNKASFFMFMQKKMEEIQSKKEKCDKIGLVKC